MALEVGLSIGVLDDEPRVMGGVLSEPGDGWPAELFYYAFHPIGVGTVDGLCFEDEGDGGAVWLVFHHCEACLLIHFDHDG